MTENYPVFTIFSGLYNSSKVIHRLFQSVENQTCRNFEWIIFNDASKDNSLELLNDFLKQIPEIEVKVFTNETNRGVSYGRAEALKLARGKYFVTWDHDDLQLPDQLETFLQLWNEYDNKDIGAICSSLQNENGERIGRPFPSEVMVSTYFDVYSKYLMGEQKPGKLNERHLCNKTDKFREALAFIEKEKMVVAPEYPNGSEVWGTMALLGNKTIYTNKILRKYFIEPGRESMSKVSREKGALRMFRDRKVWVNYFVDLLPASDWKIKIRTYLSYCLYGIYAGHSFNFLISNVSGGFKKAMVAGLFLPAKILKNRLG